MEEDIKPNQQVKVPLSRHYNYILGIAIDFSTYCTSFSFVHVDFNDDIQTIKNWETANKNSFPGREALSVLYKQEDSAPVRIDLPDKFAPIKLASDYLKQLHEYGVNQMKAYFQNRNEKSEVDSFIVKDYGIFLNEERNESIFNVREDQIRYIFSYPDNPSVEKNRAYKMQVREALEMAGIISTEDPDYRLTFITESEATAYFCLNQSNLQLKPSPEPYLVCYIGGETVGFSTIQVEEVFEAATIISHVDQAAVGSGNLEIDKNMKKYLTDKINASSEDNALLDRTCRELFNFFIDEIKPSFTNEHNGAGDYYHTIIGISNSTIKSALLEGDTFSFSYKDIESEIFDPVTGSIIKNIESAIKKLDMGISGLFLSGAISERRYLKNLVTNKFNTTTAKVISIEDDRCAVSEGLIYSGTRKRGLMVPYFLSKEVKQKRIGNKKAGSVPNGLSHVQKINYKDIDYIIGLDFGTNYSGFAFAPVPVNEKSVKHHTSLIKEIKTWPKQSDENNPKIPSMLYYSQQMEYLGKFGYEANAESARAKENGVLLRHFKLLLSRDFHPGVDDKVLSKLADFDVADAIANFLKDFNKEGINQMKRKGLSVDQNRLLYVVTTPTLWSDEAKNTLKAAVKKAAIINSKKKMSNLDQRLVFITEAEAAALYCEKYYYNEFKMNPKQRFMVCDAGGGTVNLATFEVYQEESAGGKNYIHELTSSDSAHGGSVYLDENFKDYIVQKFNKLTIRFLDEGIESLLDQFIRKIKPNFEPSLDPDMEDNINLQIPISLGLPADFEKDDGDTWFIRDNEILIPYSVMEDKVFKPVVNEVLYLIDKQLRKLPKGERQLDAILVVGGFGQSPYLRQKIIDKFENKDVGAVFIGSPPNGDLAVCRGAVSFGLEPRIVSDTITRHTYGLQVKNFRREYDNNQYCQNVLSEIVAKETKISKDDLYILRTFVIYPNEPIFAIYAIDTPEKDESLQKVITTANISPICKLTAKIPEIPEIKKGDKVEFEVAVEIARTSIYVDIFCQGKLSAANVVTKTNAVISKNKYDTGTKHEKKKGIRLFNFFR